MIDTRIATSSDTDKVRAVIDDAFGRERNVYLPKPDAVPTSENNSLNTTTIIALIDEEIVGTVCVYKEATALHVSQLAVVLRFRNQGVARKLLQSAEQLAIESDATELRLNTIQETGNVAIFQRLGFTVCEITEATWCTSDYFPQLNDVTMSRQCIA